VSSVERDADLLVVVKEVLLTVVTDGPAVQTNKCLQRVQKVIQYSVVGIKLKTLDIVS